MAKPNRLRELEQKQGIPPDIFIPELLEKLGSQKAVADHLGISQTTISTWLKDNGYIAKTVYIKQEGTDDARE